MLDIALYVSYNILILIRMIILYTNRNAKRAIWSSADYTFTSKDPEQYKMMAYTHMMVREQYEDDIEFTDDLMHAINLLLKMNGKKIQ